MEPNVLIVDAHPLLDLKAFVTRFPRPLGELESSPGLVRLLSGESGAPLRSDDQVRAAVRDLLRHGGFKPTGRNKPSSEYLIRASSQEHLSSINVAVDACNAVSLSSGLPISVVDLDVASPPFRVGIAPDESSYVFNPSGQTIDIGGLLCLFDGDGACACPVKDSQRTKTGPETRHTLSLVWSTATLHGRGAEAVAWYQDLLLDSGATVEVCATEAS